MICVHGALLLTEAHTLAQQRKKQRCYRISPVTLADMKILSFSYSNKVSRKDYDEANAVIYASKMHQATRALALFLYSFILKWLPPKASNNREQKLNAEKSAVLVLQVCRKSLRSR